MRRGWAGLESREKKGERKERLCILFEIDSNNSIQFKFKFREFKFKLNNKQ